MGYGLNEPKCGVNTTQQTVFASKASKARQICFVFCKRKKMNTKRKMLLVNAYGRPTHAH